MFQTKLKALNYMEWSKFDVNDTEHFRKLVVWLEDKKIRRYAINNRDDLRNIKSDRWTEVFDKYCKSIECPISSNPLYQLEWLVGYAIRLEYMDNTTYQKLKNFVGLHSNSMDTQLVRALVVNPLDNLDFNGSKFINLVQTIANLLKVPQHPDHLFTLTACSQLINSRLHKLYDQTGEAKVINSKDQIFPIRDIQCGISLGDAVLDDAAKGLMLLYIEDLKNLQRKINSIIVKAQNITANPKTDTKLGKVGK